MEYYAKSLSARTADSEPSLLLRFSTGQYLFNAGEGSQRAFGETVTSAKALETIFLTGLSTDEAGGLTGMMFTLSERVKHINLVGPENLSHLVSSMRSYYSRSDVYINIIERPITTPFPDGSPVFQDSFITVYSVLLSPNPEPASSASFESTAEAHRKRKRSPSPSPNGDSQPEQAMARAPLNLDDGLSPRERDLRHYRREALLRLSAERAPFVPSTKQKPTKNPRPANALLVNPLDPVFAPPPPTAPRGHNITNNTHLPAPLGRVPHDARLCYIVVGPSKRGKFLVAIADSLGVSKQARAALAGGGQSVWVDDPSVEGGKREVTPAMCLDKEVGASVTLVIDCPSSAHVDQLVGNPIWNQYRTPNADGLYPIHLIWHRWGTWEHDERYQAWMRSFGPDVEHLSGDQEILGNPTTFNSSAAMNVKLSLLDPDIFRRQDCSSGQQDQPLPPHVHPLLPTQNLSILPREGPHPLDEPSTGAMISKIRSFTTETVATMAALSPAELEAELLPTAPLFVEAVRKAREEVAVIESLRSRPAQPGDDVLVTTLGTGSSLPSKYRNVSSTHLHVPGYGHILLDAGEGTLGQLTRSVGAAEIDTVLRELKCIFVSHMHADHHTGLIRLLAKRRRVTDPSNLIYVVAPSRIRTMISEKQEFQDLGLRGDPAESQIQFVDTMALLPSSTIPAYSLPVLAGLYEATGLSRFETCLVPHRGHMCFGSILDHKDGWRIVYSGDTMPSTELIKAGEGATLLIHEATIGDDTPEDILLHKFAAENDMPKPETKLLSDMARVKGHSTFSQAIDVGRRMRASHVLLTHFSQRYPKAVSLTLQPLSPSSSPNFSAFADSQVIALGLDFLRLKIGDMWKMKHFQPAIEALYATLPDEETEGEDGADGLPVVEAKKAEGKSEKKPPVPGGGKKGKPTGGEQPKGGEGKKAKAKQQQQGKSQSAGDVTMTEPAPPAVLEEAKLL